MDTQKLNKYKENLTVVDNKVFSYESHVATIKNDWLVVEPKFKNYSRTTSKHINYVANYFGLNIQFKGILNRLER